MSDPLFTVLMPTHYRPDVIGYAIQSVLDQTFGDFELLVVGDGAVPGTAEAVAAFRDPRIRWFDFPKAPNFGYANRNRALLESRGELIAFAADDDLLFPDHLELLYRAFTYPTVQIAYGRAATVDRSGRARPNTINIELPDELARYRTGRGFAASGVVYRANALDTRAAWPDVPAGGDRELWLSIIDRHGLRALRFIREVTSLHFVASRKYEGAAGALANDRTGSDGWPAVFWPVITEGALEQSIYAAAMRADPARWIASARQATIDILSRQLWQAEARRNKAVSSLRKSDAELSAMRKSLSWRLTRPLRALRRLFMR